MNNSTVLIKMVFDRWNNAIKNCDDLLNALSDEVLMKQIAPGKNRGIYLLGHLIAVHDDMLRFLELGEARYPELHDPFHHKPDNVATPMPSVAELREIWKEQCREQSDRFASLSEGQWFEKHTAVSSEDFAKEPHRNKLNIILNRTTHLAYHTGQIQLLKA